MGCVETKKQPLNFKIMETIKFLSIGLFIVSNVAFYVGVVALVVKSIKD